MLRVGGEIAGERDVAARRRRGADTSIDARNAMTDRSAHDVILDEDLKGLDYHKLRRGSPI
jgi:hypothetical protein